MVDGYVNISSTGENISQGHNIGKLHHGTAAGLSHWCLSYKTGNRSKTAQ